MATVVAFHGVLLRAQFAPVEVMLEHYWSNTFFFTMRASVFTISNNLPTCATFLNRYVHVILII